MSCALELEIDIYEIVAPLIPVLQEIDRIEAIAAEGVAEGLSQERPRTSGNADDGPIK